VRTGVRTVGEAERATANAEAVRRMTEAQPVLVDVLPAGEAIPGMSPEVILTSGPPMDWDLYYGDACYPRHRHGEFLRFLKKVAPAYPGEELHVVCDNYATHKHAEVRNWLARPENQRITLHFVPTSCSWLTLVECFFSIITRQAILGHGDHRIRAPTDSWSRNLKHNASGRCVTAILRSRSYR
jgi:DDE superfamily endonuclease